MNDFFLIDADTLNAVLEYLRGRPYREVCQAIPILENLQPLPDGSVLAPPVESAEVREPE